MKRILCWAIMLMFLCAGNAFATPINPDGGGPNVVEDNLQTVLDDITVSSSNNNLSSIIAVGEVNDALVNDETWSITGSGGSFATMIIEIAGFSTQNSFGVYDATNVAKTVELFGSGATTGSRTVLEIYANGSVFVGFGDTGVDFSGNLFGFYINTPNGTFYSDTSLNTDNFDHMVAFQGNNSDIIQIADKAPGLWTDNEYILAWEDLYGGGDWDYQDMVLMVESVHPVPEPATMLLFGLGVLGLGVVGRKKLMK